MVRLLLVSTVCQGRWLIARSHQWANAHRSPVAFNGGINRTVDWRTPDVSLGVQRKRLAFLALVASALVLTGCQKPDEIIRYTVAKPPPREAKPAASASDAKANGATEDAGTDAGEGQDQLLGAIVPKGKMTWFFKLTGRSDAVASQVKPFFQFLGSLKITDKGPDWALPEGWEDEAGSEMRFATIRIAAADGPLEMSVIPLPTGDVSFDAYLLSNVNRWRGQFGLGPIAENQLAEHVHKIELKETIWLVKFEGRMSKSGMGAAPFAGKATGKAAKKPAGPARPAAAPPRDAEKPFDCEVPEGWTTAPAGQFQVAVYEVRDGDKQAVISVSSAGGDLAGNVNRWRGQVQLAPLEGADLAKEMHKIRVDGQNGTYVEAIGPESAPNNTTRARETILGVIVEAQGRQWFFKLKGDAELAAREKPHFEQFVQSIRFRGK